MPLPSPFDGLPVLSAPPVVVPQPIEVRRARVGGISILLFSDPTKLGDGVHRGFVGVVEEGFAPENLGVILALIDDLLQ